MREIKFRLYDEELGMDANPKFGTGNNDVNKQFATAIGKLMQFTGLKDKNGKEIYEKDIIEDYGGYVDFCKECLSYQIFHNYDKELYCYACNGDYTLQEVKEDLVVIGNLYQNPKLLN